MPPNSKQPIRDVTDILQKAATGKRLLKEILLEIGFMEETKGSTEVNQNLFHYFPYSRKYRRFNPFDSIPQAALRFKISSHQKRMTLQNFLQNDNRTSRC